MTPARLIRRSAAHHGRSNLAVLAGVATAAAVLTGALMVGSSMRASLRRLALQRLAGTAFAVESPRFFRADLAQSLPAHLPGARVAPAILTRGSLRAPDRGRSAAGVNVVGVPPEFFSDSPTASDTSAIGGAWVNAAVARELEVQPGDEILVRVPAWSPIPSESLLGRRDDAVRTLRIPVAGMFETGPAEFSLRPSQIPPRNVFIPIEELQRAIGQPARANTVLVRDATAGAIHASRVTDALRAAVTLADLGLRLEQRTLSTSAAPVEYAALESEQLVLPRAAEDAAIVAAAESGLEVRRVLAHLANTVMRADAPDASSGAESRPSSGAPTDSIVPYSVIAAVDVPDLFPGPGAPDAERPSRNEHSAPGIVLNRWAAERLDARIGDPIELSYYMLDPGGELRTENRRFSLINILEIAGPAADPGLAPTYPGITDARTMGDWDPPFPIDYELIKPADEDYWEHYRTTPKVFVALGVGQSLWAPDTGAGRRFGRLTSIRLSAPPGKSLDDLLPVFKRALLRQYTPEESGLVLRSVRDEALAASQGATDFGMLFLGFSLFLILSACMLILLMLRLAIQQRASEIGTLLATGFSQPAVRRLLLAEQTIVVAGGVLIGIPVAAAYAALMLWGLRTRWQAAVGTSALRLHLSWTDVAIGSTAAFVLALVSVAWALRGLRKQSIVSLLRGGRPDLPSGCVPGDSPAFDAGRFIRVRRLERIARLAMPRLATIATLVLAMAGAVASVFVAGPQRAALFFSTGALVLIAGLLAVRAALRRVPGRVHPGAFAFEHLGLRNAARRSDRTILTVALVAAATFIIVAVAAARHKPEFDSADIHSGHGGFALWASSDVPIVWNLSDPAGRESAGMSSVDSARLAGTTLFGFRREAGDDASCLNLYKPQSPSIIGATPAFVRRGGFDFSASLADTDTERHNPWLLLERERPDGAVPAVGDANTVNWLLHLGLGDTLIVRNDRGEPLTLQIVGTLRGSVFQSELVISESHFLRHFPHNAGYSTFLIGPARNPAEVTGALESSLADYGLDVMPTSDRLAAFAAVENTYLDTFQLLGGLGLLLGTLGAVAVLARNALERMGELALLAALGFRRRALVRIVASETAGLIAAGLLIGLVSALVGVIPNLGRPIPWSALLFLFGSILLCGLAASVMTAWIILRRPLLPELRAL